MFNWLLQLANSNIYKGRYSLEPYDLYRVSSSKLLHEMATILLLCLLVVDSLVVLAIAAKHVQTAVEPKKSRLEDFLTKEPEHNRKAEQLPGRNKHHQYRLPSFPLPSELSPSSPQQTYAEAPILPHVVITVGSLDQVTLSLSNRIAKDNSKHDRKEVDSLHQPDLPEPKNKGIEIAKAPSSRRIGQHYSIDKSILGGGVILGGLGATFLVSVFCYIRVTRRQTEATTT
ncbi:hypothetical protein FRX31_026644 [Thalictrum thalictroides]|uniref:Transmembrane protein n=1 Tax=Thalictrum thalictroides TaxID=46969 RepID=A0A7J6VGN1_THATH|nr:hypothetical protein FRX31_026644 [Thalictrum thalictroides]